MKTQEIIGRTITDILVWSKMEVGGLDEAEVFIELDKMEIIGIPWGAESKNIKRELRINSQSLFKDLNDIPVYYVNPEGKTLGEIIGANKKRQSSIFRRIKNAIGLGERIPLEYKSYRKEFRENKFKYLRNQKITDFLMFDDSDSVGFIELENGYIITETKMSPHGTGMAGLNYFENLATFEDNYGTEYKRLIGKSH